MIIIFYHFSAHQQPSTRPNIAHFYISRHGIKALNPHSILMVSSQFLLYRLANMTTGSCLASLFGLLICHYPMDTIHNALALHLLVAA